MTSSVKIVRFPFERPDGSSARISSSGSYDSFTLCASISMFFNMDFNILQAQNPSEFQLLYLYDEYEPTFRLNLKGVPFIGAIVQPTNINTFQWETLCVAYDSNIQNVTLVFRGLTLFKVGKLRVSGLLKCVISLSLVFQERSSLLAGTGTSSSFMNSLEIGKKVGVSVFTEKIASVNVWSSALTASYLGKPSK